MTLQHPTMAEKAWSRIKAKEGPPQRICLSMGADIRRLHEFGRSCQEYTFNDDTTMKVYGRGRGQTILVLDP